MIWRSLHLRQRRISRTLEKSLSERRPKLKQFRDIELDLQGLDAKAWAFLKSEVAPLLAAKDPKRGWQSLFDKLNQAKAFNYLKEGRISRMFVLCRHRPSKASKRPIWKLTGYCARLRQ